MIYPFEATALLPGQLQVSATIPAEAVASTYDHPDSATGYRGGWDLSVDWDGLTVTVDCGEEAMSGQIDKVLLPSERIAFESAVETQLAKALEEWAEDLRVNP